MSVDPAAIARGWFDVWGYFFPFLWGQSLRILQTAATKFDAAGVVVRKKPAPKWWNQRFDSEDVYFCWSPHAIAESHYRLPFLLVLCLMRNPGGGG